MTGLIVLGILAFVVFLVAARSIRIIPQSRVAIVQRLGRYHRTAESGLTFVVPVVDRMLPYYYDVIVPDLLTGQTVLIGAHGNSLRALVKHLDGISDADIAGLNIPTGIPLVYRLDADLQPVVPGGEYLDPEAAKKAAAAVAAQGKG